MKPKKPMKFVSLRNAAETWICEDYSQRRNVDGEEFIYVHKPEKPARKVWMNINGLVKAK